MKCHLPYYCFLSFVLQGIIHTGGMRWSSSHPRQHGSLDYLTELESLRKEETGDKRSLSSSQCSPNTFTTVIELDLEIDDGDLTKEEAIQIGEEFKDAYNDLALHSCDPKVRRIESIAPVDYPARRQRKLRGNNQLRNAIDFEESIQAHNIIQDEDGSSPSSTINRRLGRTVYAFEIYGSCNGCESDSGAYDDCVDAECCDYGDCIRRRSALEAKEDFTDRELKAQIFEGYDEYNYETCTCGNKKFQNGPPNKESILTVFNNLEIKKNGKVKQCKDLRTQKKD